MINHDGSNDLTRYFEQDLKKPKTSAAKLRAIRNMIESSKRIAATMEVRPKTGQAAAQIQQMKINSMILKELESIRRSQDLRIMKENEARYKRSLLIDSIVQEEKKSPWEILIDERHG